MCGPFDHSLAGVCPAWGRWRQADAPPGRWHGETGGRHGAACGADGPSKRAAAADADGPAQRAAAECRDAAAQHAQHAAAKSGEHAAARDGAALSTNGWQSTGPDPATKHWHVEARSGHAAAGWYSRHRQSSSARPRWARWPQPSHHAARSDRQARRRPQPSDNASRPTPRPTWRWAGDDEALESPQPRRRHETVVSSARSSEQAWDWRQPARREFPRPRQSSDHIAGESWKQSPRYRRQSPRYWQPSDNVAG